MSRLGIKQNLQKEIKYIQIKNMVKLVF